MPNGPAAFLGPRRPSRGLNLLPNTENPIYLHPKEGIPSANNKIMRSACFISPPLGGHSIPKSTRLRGRGFPAGGIMVVCVSIIPARQGFSTNLSTWRWIQPKSEAGTEKKGTEAWWFRGFLPHSVGTCRHLRALEWALCRCGKPVRFIWNVQYYRVKPNKLRSTTSYGGTTLNVMYSRSNYSWIPDGLTQRCDWSDLCKTWTRPGTLYNMHNG